MLCLTQAVQAFVSHVEYFSHCSDVLFLIIQASKVSNMLVLAKFYNTLSWKGSFCQGEGI